MKILCPVNVRATQLLVPKPDEKLCKGKTDHGRFKLCKNAYCSIFQKYDKTINPKRPNSAQK